MFTSYIHHRLQVLWNFLIIRWFLCEFNLFFLSSLVEFLWKCHIFKEVTAAIIILSRELLKQFSRLTLRRRAIHTLYIRWESLLAGLQILVGSWVMVNYINCCRWDNRPAWGFQRGWLLFHGIVKLELFGVVGPRGCRATQRCRWFCETCEWYDAVGRELRSKFLEIVWGPYHAPFIYVHLLLLRLIWNNAELAYLRIDILLDCASLVG